MFGRPAAATVGAYCIRRAMFASLCVFRIRLGRSGQIRRFVTVSVAVIAVGERRQHERYRKDHALATSGAPRTTPSVHLEPDAVLGPVVIGRIEPRSLEAELQILPPRALKPPLEAEPDRVLRLRVGVHALAPHPRRRGRRRNPLAATPRAACRGRIRGSSPSSPDRTPAPSCSAPSHSAKP